MGHQAAHRRGVHDSSVGAHPRGAVVSKTPRWRRLAMSTMEIETSQLEPKLRFLRSPASYGDPKTPVVCIETHMSWVFLVGDKAFKLKKPVRHGFLDFSTVDARGFYCREEVRLNRRLAPQVYVGVLALQRAGDTFTLLPDQALPAPGRTVDWLVAMRRLPAHDMLDQRIAHANVTTGEIDALVAVLARFYRSAARATLGAPAQHDRFAREQALNRAVLLHAPVPVPGAVHALERLDVALARHADLLATRASQGRLVEGHGDLRMEHVCLLQPPVVIDCLEFNTELRQVDPFEEIAFLGLECSMAGAGWIARRLFSGCVEALADRPPPTLMALYTAQRALLRARLAMSHLLDPLPRMPDKWPALAQRYLECAVAALNSDPR